MTTSSDTSPFVHGTKPIGEIYFCGVQKLWNAMLPADIPFLFIVEQRITNGKFIASNNLVRHLVSVKYGKSLKPTIIFNCWLSTTITIGYLPISAAKYSKVRIMVLILQMRCSFCVQTNLMQVVKNIDHTKPESFITEDISIWYGGYYNA